jgi:chromosome segregation ATPase
LHYPVALAAQLSAAQEALSNEQSAQSAATQALAEEKGAHLTAEQALKTYDEARAKLSQALKTAKAAYSATRDKLASKSKELDDAVIQEQEANMLRKQIEAKLTDAENRLTVVEGEKKDQGLLLEMARQALSKREDSSALMILMAVANAMALLKSHLPDLDVKLLHKDFAVDEAECEVLTSGAYDVNHEFALSYDFSSLAEFEDNINPRNM